MLKRVSTAKIPALHWPKNSRVGYNFRGGPGHIFTQQLKSRIGQIIDPLLFKALSSMSPSLMYQFYTNQRSPLVTVNPYTVKIVASLLKGSGVSYNDREVAGFFFYEQDNLIKQSPLGTVQK